MYFIDFSVLAHILFFFFKQKTAYEMRISDWSSDVCSSDLLLRLRRDSPAAGTVRKQTSGGAAAARQPVHRQGRNRIQLQRAVRRLPLLEPVLLQRLWR